MLSDISVGGVYAPTIGVETAQLYPQMNIGGSVGFAGPFSGLSGSDFGGTIGPLLSWTIPNRTAGEARIAQAGFATDAALAGTDWNRGSLAKLISVTLTCGALAVFEYKLSIKKNSDRIVASKVSLRG